MAESKLAYILYELHIRNFEEKLPIYEPKLRTMMNEFLNRSGQDLLY